MNRPLYDVFAVLLKPAGAEGSVRSVGAADEWAFIAVGLRLRPRGWGAPVDKPPAACGARASRGGPR